MDTPMSNSSSNSSAMEVTMIPWLHFTGGDSLIFKSLRPSSHGALAAACIVLVVIAVLERLAAATRGALDRHWARAAEALTAPRPVGRDCDPSAASTTGKEKVTGEVDMISFREVSSERRSSLRNEHIPRLSPPFIASYDIPRAAIFAFQALLSYLLMLAVMTFQAAYLISIVLGLGLGEMLFRRLGDTDGHSLH